MPTAPTVKAAAVPELTPIRASLNTPSVAQSTPRPTRTKTIADKIMVLAILAILLHPHEFIIRGEFSTPPFQRTPVWFPQRRPFLQPRTVLL